MIAWSDLCPPHTPTLALPGWHHPRLLVCGASAALLRKGCAFYPAYRHSARLMRFLLGVYALAARERLTRTSGGGDWPLGRFIEHALPSAEGVAIRFGTPGPAQKVTVQVLGRDGDVLGYLKAATAPAARARLANEAAVLRALPGRMHPDVLRYGSLNGGDALLIAPLVGRPLTRMWPPPPGVRRFAERAASDRSFDLDDHPWVRRALDRGVRRDAFEALEGRRWPIVFQHGDFAPWNLLERSDGTLEACDWEYGTAEGFPCLDLAFYVLQVMRLIYRRAPADAAARAVAFLAGSSSQGLDRQEATAIVRLTAIDAHAKYVADGHDRRSVNLGWWEAIWRMERLA